MESSFKIFKFRPIEVSSPLKTKLKVSTSSLVSSAVLRYQALLLSWREIKIEGGGKVILDNSKVTCQFMIILTTRLSHYCT